MLIFSSDQRKQIMQQGPVRILLFVFLFKSVHNQDSRFATDCLTPNNEIGLCIEIQNCKKLLQQVELNNTSTFGFIRESRCGPPNEDISRPKVCCGPDIDFVKKDVDVEDIRPMPTSRPIATTTVATIITTATATSFPSSGNDVLPKMCGKQKIFLTERIFGGTEAGVGEFPWLARLVHYNIYNKTRLGCAGFLIHRRFVLTAAHCLIGPGVKNLGQLQGVLLGMHNDTKARICSGKACTDPPLPVRTLNPVIHKGYDSYLHTHDIALLPLVDKVNFTDFIKAICLPNISSNSPLLTISGWGRTETDSTSRAKLKVDLPMVNHTICAEKYKSLGLPISDLQICAGGEDGHDSCAGDSGGPLMTIGDNERWFAEGIVSFGNSCGREGWPGVYTNIPAYYNWIVESIRDVKKNKYRTDLI